MTQNGIKWFKLCGFSGLIYNTISFHCQKVQILKKQKENHPPHPSPPAAFNRQGPTDCYAKKKKNSAKSKELFRVNRHWNCVQKKTAAAVCKLNASNDVAHLGNASFDQQCHSRHSAIWETLVVLSRVGVVRCATRMKVLTRTAREREVEQQFSSVPQCAFTVHVQV